VNRVKGFGSDERDRHRSGGLMHEGGRRRPGNLNLGRRGTLAAGGASAVIAAHLEPGSRRGMNVVRILLSLFVIALLIISVAGWIWAGENQPPDAAVASRVVLAVGMAAGFAGMVAIWRWRP
jgi:hypothetical protein